MCDYEGLTQPETAHILFNSLDASIMFVTINNVLLAYKTRDLQQGFELQFHHAFAGNIKRIEQQRKLLVLACDDERLIVYQWDERKVVEEVEIIDLSAMSSEESSVAVGTKTGTLQVFKE